MQASSSVYSGSGQRPPPLGTYSSSSSSAMPTPRPYGRAAKQQEILYDIPPISPAKSRHGDASDPQDGGNQSTRTPDGRGNTTPNNRGVNGGPLINSRRTTTKSPLRSPIDGRSNGEAGYGATKGTRSTVKSPPPPPLPLRRGTGSPMENGREGSIVSGRSSTYTKRGGDRVTSPHPADLAHFAHHCQVMYFTSNPPEASSQYISTTLASLPPPHRASYTRIQASLRAQAHDRATRLRLIEFHALISSTFSNASLSLGARHALNGKQAREERRNKLAKFVQQWCLKSGVGVEPFFKGLYTALRLQSKGERSVGGPGGKRIVWEIDDAVFMEAGGKEFMQEAVTIIKGVLGFDDMSLTEPPKIKPITLPTTTRPIHKYPSMEMLISLDGGNTSTNSVPAATPTPTSTHSPVSSLNPTHGYTTRPGTLNRYRSTSDPFLDPRNSPTKPAVQDTVVGTPSPTGSVDELGQTKKHRGPAPPVPTHRPGRSISGNAPPLPPDHTRSTSSTSDRLSPPLAYRRANRSLSGTSDTSNPLSPGLDEPLLAADTAESVVAALEDAAEEADTLASLTTQYERQYGNRIRSQSNRSIPEDLQALIAKGGEGALDQDEDEDEDFTKPRIRLWTLPAHLTGPELDALVALFPPFITNGMQKLRFPLPRPAAPHPISTEPHKASYADAEAGVLGRSGDEAWWPVTAGIRIPPEDAEGFIFPGTGRMWVGDALREEGYRGSFWARLGRWFRKWIPGL